MKTMSRAEPWLVVGAAGLVGSHVRTALARRSVIATYHHTHAVDALMLDATDREATSKLVADARPRVIVMAAADAYVERCEREPLITRRVNVEGVRNVVDAARKIGAWVVFFSSEYVFNGAKREYNEDDPVHPINEYGRQKVEAEAIVATHQPHLICRTSGAFGWEALCKNFVCRLIDALRAGRPFRVPNDQLVTPTFAVDLARAVRELVDRGSTGIRHVVGPEILRREDFALMVAEVFGLSRDLIQPVPTSELGLAAARPRCGLRDELLTAELGHRLATPREALARMRQSERRDLQSIRR